MLFFIRCLSGVIKSFLNFILLSHLYNIIYLHKYYELPQFFNLWRKPYPSLFI